MSSGEGAGTPAALGVALPVGLDETLGDLLAWLVVEDEWAFPPGPQAVSDTARATATGTAAARGM